MSLELIFSAVEEAHTICNLSEYHKSRQLYLKPIRTLIAKRAIEGEPKVRILFFLE